MSASTAEETTSHGVAADRGSSGLGAVRGRRELVASSPRAEPAG
ncbi:hypothetical protein SCE1572_47355 [Sorangium cellulosum So0157-2]|uniref:Uncharacterized protein n=1 Tax=Sorangium cellulosum So0157-2 TaxID=1254432 RepID=S4Y7Q8_SORCE|nr:hypothetical protein SCE1572_47355 [Sorangium cellulosum So0157-2]